MCPAIGHTLPHLATQEYISMTLVNRQFLLAARPHGMVKETDFELATSDVPSITEGQALVRTRYISLDPSMRGQMENRADYVAPIEIGDVMRARGVGEIVDSKSDALRIGSLAWGAFGMQDYAVVNADAPQFRLLAEGEDPELALGVLGGTGLTAYFGMLQVGLPKAGDVVVVSGAAGATGSVAGQIAKIKGCTVFGMAGSDEKCAWLTELGFDGVVNYKTEDVATALDALCPNGMNIFFDNVGGEILDLCLDRLQLHSRVVLCGGISRYNATGELAGPKNYFNLIFRRSRMEGFLLHDYADQFPQAVREMRSWIDAGRLQSRTTVIEGFEKLPRALIKLFEGGNIGKMMVRTD